MASTEARDVDRACGRLKELIKKVLGKLAAPDGAVTQALEHHFKLDAGRKRGLGHLYHEAKLTAITRVFSRIQSDLDARMTYVHRSLDLGCAGSAVAYVPRVNPKTIHLCGEFFEEVPSSGDGWSWALLHEQAHYAYRHPGAPNTIGDRAYLHRSPRKYLRLSTEAALRNADSYAFFAREVLDPGFDWALETQP